jgi:hypothetical protein
MRKSLAFAAVLTLLFEWSAASAGKSPSEHFASRTELRQIDERRSIKPSEHNELKARCSGKVLNSNGFWVDTTWLVASKPYCTGPI